MVQKPVRRRTSLILGAVLALLLGVATGFLLLALPVTTVESITTTIGLSRIMVQAEPPISPNDRTILAVLAAILASGIGWVLVDWLLFGRVGMTALMRPREDEYEEDEDAYRPTDPLDLISPEPVADWPVSPPIGDARRPLSARTDIGDPPASFPPPAPLTEAAHLDRPLPPIGQILPGVASAFPPLPAAMEQGAAAAPISSTLDLGSDQFAAPAHPAAPIGMPDWLPSPGIRPELSRDDLENSETSQAGETGSSGTSGPVAPALVPAPPPIMPTPPAYQQLADEPFVPFAPPIAAPPLATPTPPQPAMLPPLFASPPIAAVPPPVIAAPITPPPSFPAAYIPPAASPAKLPATVSSAQLLSDKVPLDKVAIDDLLTRLEQGMRMRRAHTTSSLPAPSVIIPPVAPVATEQTPGPLPVYHAPAYDVPARSPLPAGLAMGAPPAPPPFQAPPAAATVALPVATAAAPDGNGMIDQPLHATLEQLRNMVRR